MNQFLQSKREKHQFIGNYTVFILNGMLALSVGSLLPFIRESRGIAYAFGGILVSLHSVGNLCSSFFAGVIAGAVGRKKSILLFNSFFALAYLLIIFGNGNVCLATAFFASGLARGATSNFCNTAVNKLAPGKAWILNGLHAMFSIGAFTFPILLTLITSGGQERWIYGCYFMCLMGIGSWLIYFFLPVDEAEKKTQKVVTEKKTGRFAFFKEPLFILCTATLFFYLCAEQGVIGWMITYFQDTGLMSSSLAQLTASILWIMMLAGRLTTAWLSSRVKKERLLLAMGIGVVVFFPLIMLSHSSMWIFIGIMGFGYSMAGVYPTTVSFFGSMMQKYPISWSFMLTMASCGSIIMPSVIGRIAESAGIFYGMTSIVVAVVIDLSCIVGLVWYRSKRKE